MKTKTMKHDDFYKRNGVDIRAARNLCAILGLKANRHLLFAAKLLVLMNPNGTKNT